MALLDRGEQVIGIDNLNDYYDPALKRARLDRLVAAHGNAFSFEQVDFGDQEALETFAAPHKFDRIVHLGAQAGVRYSLVNPQAYVRSNLMGQINMLELARHREVEHFVYASSSSVYGGNKTLPFRVEDRVDHPISLYAATKKSDELMSESCPSVPPADDRPALLHRLWTVGPPGHGDGIFTKALFEGSR
jgi:UDP-glucuronate 4-epimerase